MNLNARKHWPGVMLVSMMAVACAHQPRPSQDPAVDGDDRTGGAALDGGQVPPTDDEVMYRVFAAELLGSEGDVQGAAAEYLAAAMESEDPEIAKRATSVALAARAWQHAAMAAVRWALLAPDDLEALETAARTLLAADDYVGAEHHLSRLLAVQAHDPMSGWGTVARLLVAARHTDKATRVLERLIADHAADGNPHALYARSQLAARNGDLETASALAERAVAAAPDIPELHAWAGRVAVNLGDHVRAAQHYEAAWSLRPEDRVHALLYAELLRQSGFVSRANEVLAGLPDEPDMRFTRVAFALQSGNRALAEELYRAFESAAYGDAEERAYHAARSAELLGHTDEAIRWYEQVNAGEPGLIALGRRALLLADLGRIDEARRVLAEAREGGNPDTQIETLLVESQILLDAGRTQTALEILDGALANHARDVRLLYTRALVAVELDRLDITERDLQTVIEQDPENAAALNALGYTLADRTERLEEAERLINAAYRLEPDEASIIDSMGWVAYRLGRLEEAESYLRQAYNRDPNAEIAAHLGEVLWARGNQEDARTIWSEGLSIDPANKVLNETLGRLGVRL